MSKGIFSLIAGVLRAGRYWPLIAVICYGLVLFVGLYGYLVWDTTGVILGTAALFFTASFNTSGRGSIRYFFIALASLLLYLLIPAKTFLCISCLCGCLFMIETFYGRMNFLPVLVLVMMSPLFEYAMNVFSFPIRLALTGWAGSIIRITGQEVSVQGNMITCNGNEFSVDPACMGLQMMVTASLCGMILIGFYQQQYKKALGIWLVLSILAGMILMNVASNLLRIIFLVYLNIMPSTVMHDVTGILCLVLYVIVPLLFLIQWMVRKYGKPVQVHRKRYVLRSAVKLFLLNLLLPAGLLIVFIINKSKEVDQQVLSNVPAMPGYTVQSLPGNIIRLNNDTLLVYIKHIPASYYTEHNPMICWKGSGYEFYKVEEKLVGGHTIYTALLQQEKDRLYTAWWYDNGLVSTSSQLQWRWDVLLGAHPYSLVNVTASSEHELRLAVNEILNKRRLSVYL
ncbi:exosortase N [Chitinophaga filiformis]|uniref:Exosortase N n=1 Tax=Chitinophaga filiformis TaxID=104663 RepID=A0A1G7N6A3_CHIFI|nr:exosortase N [Chitinophaga filiformis]SDF69534.1 exosortase N [Chitinophaga filiformis]